MAKRGQGLKLSVEMSEKVEAGPMPPKMAMLEEGAKVLSVSSTPVTPDGNSAAPAKARPGGGVPSGSMGASHCIVTVLKSCVSASRKPFASWPPKTTMRPPYATATAPVRPTGLKRCRLPYTLISPITSICPSVMLSPPHCA